MKSTDKREGSKGKGRIPTIHDVAELAGVSIGTVSRALNQAGRVSPSTSAAIRAAAAKLGYAPDAGAQSLRTQRTGAIGLLLPEIADPYSARIVHAVESRLQREGYSLLLANTHNDPVRERKLVELYRRRVDGMVIGVCGDERLETLASLRDSGVPTVAIDRDLDKADSGVQVDYFGGTLNAIQYLLNLGHRRIAMLVNHSGRRPGRERIAGYRAAFAERHLTPDPALIRGDYSSMEYALSDTMSLLSSDAPPSAIVCMGSRTLAGVLHGLRHSGRSVPNDISVISIGDTDLAQLFTPAITSLTWDYEVVGNAVAELMLKRLAPEPRPPSSEVERVVVTMQLITRDSCSPIREAPASTDTRSKRTSGKR